jgi:hypothetical protein
MQAGIRPSNRIRDSPQFETSGGWHDGVMSGFRSETVAAIDIVKRALVIATLGTGEIHFRSVAMS